MRAPSSVAEQSAHNRSVAGSIPAGITRALAWGSGRTMAKHKWRKLSYDVDNPTYIFTKRQVGCWMEKARRRGASVGMGQHQIQRQILQNFSFAGRQPNSRETWFLTTSGYQPISRSVDRVGFFEVDCSEDVDSYITDLENGFKDSLQRFSRGAFTKADVRRRNYTTS